MINELRHYVAPVGKGDAMLKVMADHILPIFNRMGFRVLDYWVQDDDPRHLWYTMEWPSAAAIKEGWERFRADPEWLKVKAASGGVFEKVESFTLRRTPTK
ncbi:MAG: NIPSNAP family protein [Alphaproteobacteria bacterium]